MGLSSNDCQEEQERKKRVQFVLEMSLVEEQAWTVVRGARRAKSEIRFPLSPVPGVAADQDHTTLDYNLKLTSSNLESRRSWYSIDNNHTIVVVLFLTVKSTV
jgi:hypothetical protein